MYLCFIDESGSPPKPTAKNPRPYLVIAAVILHEAQWHGVAQELKRLREKSEFQVRGEIKWRFFGADNNDSDNSVRHLDQAARAKFREQFFGLLAKRRSIKTMAGIASISAGYALSYVNTQEDLYAYTYKVVSERFQYFLQDISREVGDTQLGIVIADHRGKKQDDLLRREHHGLLDRVGMYTSDYQNYVETIFMTPSHLSVGIQFADMVAGAIGRAYNSNDRTYFRLIEPTLRKSPTGRLDGWGLIKFPKTGWI